MNYIYINGELMHHGVKGQKWGIRRYQNKDGTLTAAGKKHYSDGSEKKVTHRDKLEQLYRSQGYSDEDAAKLAKGRDIAEKVLIGIGVAALAGVAAYGITKYVRNNADTILKEGSTLTRIASSGDATLHENFFAANNKKDATKYAGLYGGGQLGGIVGKQNVYQKQISVNDRVRVAGSHSARKAYYKLMADDPEFKKYAIDHGLFYNKFNQHMPSISRDESGGGKEAWNKFTNALREKGYDAVKDVNDRKYSGYNAKTANIYFNTSKFGVKSVKQLDKTEMVDAYKKARNMLNRDEALSAVRTNAVLGGAFVTTLGLAKRASDSKSYKDVANDKKEKDKN